MESDSWTRLNSSARRHQSRSDAFHAEDYDGEEEQRHEFMCPFCAEDYDIVGLCCHIDEEHGVEANMGVCPVCAKKVGSDLVRHMTVQHGNLLKVQRRRRLRRGVSNLSFSILRRELREGNLQSLLGGSSFFAPSSEAEPDPLLTSFVYNPPSNADDEPSKDVQPLSSIKASSVSVDESSSQEFTDSVVRQSPLLSDEDRQERIQRCEFVRELMLSTFLDDDL